MKRFLTVFFLYCLFPLLSFAKEQVPPPLGELTLSNKYLTISQVELPVYKVFSQDYIAIFPLADLGYTVDYNANSNSVVVYKPTKSLLYTKIPSSKYWDADSLVGTSFELFTGSIYIENLRTHGIVANNRVLIPVETLNTLGFLHNTKEDYFLTFSQPPPVIATSFKVENYTPYQTFASVMDIYWNKGWVTKTTSYHLTPYANINRKPLDSDLHYVTSIVTTVKNNHLSISNFDLLGQLNTSLFTLNDRVASIEDLALLGDPLSIHEIIQAEDTIRSKGLVSKTPFLIWTDLKTQKTYIFENQNNKWHLIKHFLSSTGKASSPTPVGEFELTRKVPYFGIEKGYRCKNAFGFIGTTYLYHSVMFDVTGTYELQGKGPLGRPASAGCIRLSTENSLWLYDNMLSETKVYIQ